MKYHIYLDSQSRVTKIVYVDKTLIRFHYASDVERVRKRRNRKWKKSKNKQRNKKGKSDVLEGT